MNSAGVRATLWAVVLVAGAVGCSTSKPSLRPGDAGLSAATKRFRLLDVETRARRANFDRLQYKGAARRIHSESAWPDDHSLGVGRGLEFMGHTARSRQIHESVDCCPSARREADKRVVLLAEMKQRRLIRERIQRRTQLVESSETSSNVLPDIEVSRTAAAETFPHAARTVDETLDVAVAAKPTRKHVESVRGNAEPLRMVIVPNVRRRHRQHS